MSWGALILNLAVLLVEMEQKNKRDPILVSVYLDGLGQRSLYTPHRLRSLNLPVNYFLI